MTMRELFYIAFIVLITYFVSINLIYIVLSLMSQRSNAYRRKQAYYTRFDDILNSFLTIPVSIVIPAFNEERVVTDCVYSCLKLAYPNLEVIVVNDGSTDGTLAALSEEFDLYPVDHFYRDVFPAKPVKAIYHSRKYDNLRVIDKVNGGKADSENAGANLARYRYVCITDADSIFNKDGMLRVMRPVLLDPGRIVAVGGQIRVGNALTVHKGEIETVRFTHRIIPAIQTVEYLRAFIGNRLGWSAMNAQLVISGAFGLWRKDALEERRGFSTTTTHEDIEMTFGLHHKFRKERRDYAIVSMADPVTWTEVPGTLRALMKQRERWQRVVIETFWRYKRMLLNPRYGAVGMLGMPYYLIYEILGPYVELSAYLLVAVAYFLNFLSLPEFLLFLVVSVGLSAYVSLLGLAIEQYNYNTFRTSELPRLVLLALVEPIFYRQTIDLARSIAIVNVIRGRREWSSPERKGH